MERDVSAQDGDRCTQQYAKGQRPAFVQSGKDQEDEEQRKSEDRPGGNALLRLLLLERHARIVKARAVRHSLVESFLERSPYLSRTVTRCAGDVELSGVVFVEAI